MSDIDVTEMGDAGKARPVPRGRYSDTETYDYLDFVYSGDASYIAKKLTTGNPPAENNEYWQLFARGGTLTENSDVSDTTVTFEQAENRANIFSKDSLKTIMGKISKMYSDLKTVAFSGKYTDLEGRVTVTNNDLATIPGTAWDAVRGAQIRKDLDKLNSDLLPLNFSGESIILFYVSRYPRNKTMRGCFIVSPNFPTDLPPNEGEGYVEFLRDEIGHRVIVLFHGYGSKKTWRRNILSNGWSGEWIQIFSP